MTLAASGLLDHQPATVPSRNERHVRLRHPRIRFAPTGLIVEAERMPTAAEPASIISLVITLARKLHSHGLAERYRRSCGVPETSLPPDAFLPGRNNEDLLIAEARAWIISHMHEDIDTPDIAAQFQVSSRTLTRRFSLATGVTRQRFCATPGSMPHVPCS
ncbi:MAG: hypothetical protein ABW203_01155 [Novosphingobium sp.]